jgi:ElaB/YqjD/DUF883 family membrane-anchored ribosome-binding protein
MGKSSDQLREEIDQQRADAGAKIDRLQQQVQDQVQGTRDQVVGTAEQVRDEAKAMVTDSVDSVRQTVESFDLERHVQERPLVSAGMALLGGFVLGAVLGGEGHGQHRTSYSSGANSTGGGHDAGGFVSGIRSAAQKSGLEDTLSNAAAALMGSVTEQFKQSLDRSFPGFSDKLGTAQHEPGSFTDKARATQREAQQM